MKKIKGRVLSSVLTLFVLLSFCLVPVKSWAGNLDVLVFGNYDFLSPNGGAIAQGSTESWQGQWHNGYGGGLGLLYWFSPRFGFRIDAQGNFFGMNQPGESLDSAPITGGIEYKLSDGLDHYAYVVLDAGVAYELSLPGISSIAISAPNGGHAWSSYFDGGLGYNFSFLFAEVKYAYIQDPVPNLPGQNAMWYIPVTVGFNF
jgi:hypothetical protein